MKTMDQKQFLSGMGLLQSLYPQRPFDIDVHWSMFQDLGNGELFVKAIFELCRDWKDGFPPAIGVIRERYFDLKKRNLPIALPDLTVRWTTPPKEWLELKKKLGLKI